MYGGLSSNGEWLSTVMKKVNHPRVGTLPDFGNFLLEEDVWYEPSEYQPYYAVLGHKAKGYYKTEKRLPTEAKNRIAKL